MGDMPCSTGSNSGRSANLFFLMISRARSRDSNSWTWLVTASASSAVRSSLRSPIGRRNMFSRPSIRMRASDLYRGVTRLTAALASESTGKLRRGYIRDPSVAVEIESYRPFFILGEVAAPGQYPYVPNMSVESAVAIAGGFSPRARRDTVTLTHTNGSGSMRVVAPLGTALSPGDTVLVGERLSLIHISEPTRRTPISYAVF